MAFKFCPECGFKLDREYKFCPECGYNLKSNEQIVQPQAEIMPKSKADNNQIVESLFYTAGTAYIYPFIVIDKQKLANIANK